MTLRAFRGARPTARGEEATFFARCQEERLCLQRCGACTRAVFYPRAVCPHCGAQALAWEDASGRGGVHTFTVQHRFTPEFDTGEPAVLAIIALEEGVRMLARVLEPPDQVAVGMPVEVRFAEASEGFKVPVFVRAGVAP